MARDIQNVSAAYRQAGAGYTQAAFSNSEKASAAGAALLIVGDEPFLTEQLRNRVEAKGYQAFTARSGEEALRLYSSNAGGFAVAVTDPRLPGMRGKAMIEALLRLEPQALLLIVSDSGAEVVRDSRKKGVPLLRHLFG